MLDNSAHNMLVVGRPERGKDSKNNPSRDRRQPIPYLPLSLLAMFRGRHRERYCRPSAPGCEQDHGGCDNRQHPAGQLRAIRHLPFCQP